MGRLSWLFPKRLQDSFFAAEFVMTTTQTSQTTMHAAGQSVADWPAEEMKAFLRDSRGWGTWCVVHAVPFLAKGVRVRVSHPTLNLTRPSILT